MRKHLQTLPQASRPVGTKHEQGAEQAKATPAWRVQQEAGSLSPAAFTTWLHALGVEAAWRVGMGAGLGGGPRECPETWVCTDRRGCEGGRSSETEGTASEPQSGRDALLCQLFASRD